MRGEAPCRRAREPNLHAEDFKVLECRPRVGPTAQMISVSDGRANIAAIHQVVPRLCGTRKEGAVTYWY